jgi:hypothetical protein
MKTSEQSGQHDKKHLVEVLFIIADNSTAFKVVSAWDPIVVNIECRSIIRVQINKLLH